jgi:hypothetical protein
LNTRLHFVYSPADHTSLDQDGAFLEIDVAPFQTKNFANSKSQALRDQHRSVGFAQVLEQFKELLDVENARPLQTLACILHTRQRDGILADYDDSMTTSKRIRALAGMALVPARPFSHGQNSSGSLRGAVQDSVRACVAGAAIEPRPIRKCANAPRNR